MLAPLDPSLYQINTRAWLYDLALSLGRPATLDDVPDAALDALEAHGFDWIWLLGVWQTGPAARAVSRSQPDWQREYAATLPNFTEADVTGSPFAVQAYTAHTDVGGDAALARFRQRLRERGLSLMLDFVPNHTAPDHPWVFAHPEYYVHGSDDDLAREPQNYIRIETAHGPRVLAHGRDPYFPGWPDTLQLNYRCAATRAAMTAELLKVAERCDGARCDMAMLLLPDVIERTWGRRAAPADGSSPVLDPFWPDATARVHRDHPGFLLLAEVYWDREWDLLQQGFDYAYDKRLYDRLRHQDARGVRDHLHADPCFLRKLAHFLENHDEPRAATAFPRAIHKAAATVAFLMPGLRFFHEGQFEGRCVKLSMHLGRRPAEPVDADLEEFYCSLLVLLKHPTLRDGQWKLLECGPAWDGNSTWEAFLAFAWDGPAGERLVVAVNYGPAPGQCHVRLPWSDLARRSWTFADLLGPSRHDWPGDDLAKQGLALDAPAWQYHVFTVTPS